MVLALLIPRLLPTEGVDTPEAVLRTTEATVPPAMDMVTDTMEAAARGIPTTSMPKRSAKIMLQDLLRACLLSLVGLSSLCIASS